MDINLNDTGCNIQKDDGFTQEKEVSKIRFSGNSDGGAIKKIKMRNRIK